MKGDTHVAMAEAVDGANVVLYGVCEKYKEVRCFTACCTYTRHITNTITILG